MYLHVLHDVRVIQVQLDEWFALLSAVKDGEVSEVETIKRLERSPQWGWAAMAPESKLLLALDVEERTLAMAQRVIHYVAQIRESSCRRDSEAPIREDVRIRASEELPVRDLYRLVRA